MTLVGFKGGSIGVPVFISPDAVSFVQADADPESKLTVIGTLDGKEHRVQENIPTVVEALLKGAS